MLFQNFLWENSRILVGKTPFLVFSILGLYQIQNSSKISLAIEKASDTRMSLLIRDAEGNVLHREIIAKGKESYKRNFNLMEMGDGTYYFELVTDGESVTKKVSLSTATTRMIALD